MCLVLTKTVLRALGSRGKPPQWLNYPWAQYLEGDAAYLHRPLGCVTSTLRFLYPRVEGARGTFWGNGHCPLLYNSILLSTNYSYGSKVEGALVASEEMIRDPLPTTLWWRLALCQTGLPHTMVWFQSWGRIGGFWGNDPWSIAHHFMVTSCSLSNWTPTHHGMVPKLRGDWWFLRKWSVIHFMMTSC